MEPPSRRPGAASLWDPDLSELTPDGPHHETVSTPGDGTSEKKAQIPMRLEPGRSLLAPQGAHQNILGTQELGADDTGPSLPRGGDSQQAATPN